MRRLKSLDAVTATSGHRLTAAAPTQPGLADRNPRCWRCRRMQRLPAYSLLDPESGGQLPWRSECSARTFLSSDHGTLGARRTALCHLNCPEDPIAPNRLFPRRNSSLPTDPDYPQHPIEECPGDPIAPRPTGHRQAARHHRCGSRLPSDNPYSPGNQPSSRLVGLSLRRHPPSRC
jgi:hypothetical protein